MPTFLVSVLYDPGTPKHYVVENVADHRAARNHVRNNVIGYDPGVPVEVTEVPIHKNKPVRFSNLGPATN
jgi:hypothetical protein